MLSAALLAHAVITESKPLLIMWHSLTALQSSVWAYMLWKRAGLAFLSTALIANAVCFGFYAVYIYVNHHGEIPGWSWPIGLAMTGQLLVTLIALFVERRINRDKVDRLSAEAKSPTFLNYISGNYIPYLRGPKA